MTDSRNKGARYMVDVCRLLSHWICGTPEDANADALAFRPRSTALMPIDGHWSNKGDLVSRPDLRFPLCVECKKQESGDLDGLFDAPKWCVWDWWEQAKGQALAIHLTPALIFCRNRRQNRVVLPRDTARCLDLKPLHGPLLDVTRPNGEVLTVCLLDDLLAVPPSRLARLSASGSVRSSRAATSRSACRSSTTSPRLKHTLSGRRS